MTDGDTGPTTARAGVAAQIRAVDGRQAADMDLDRLVAWGRQRAAGRVLDLATGGGETALAFAGFTPTVVATDATVTAVRAAREVIARHGAAAVHVLAADELALPFRDETFGVVTCRLAAHRFPELLPVLRQIARVLRRGGSVLFASLVCHDDPEIATLALEVDKGRDPRHVRAFRQIEWTAFLRAAGLTVIDEAVMESERSWDEWTEQMSPNARAALDRLVCAAPARYRKALQVALDGDRIQSITARILVLRADKD